MRCLRPYRTLSTFKMNVTNIDVAAAAVVVVVVVVAAITAAQTNVYFDFSFWSCT